jgi:hypothetical protein
MFKAKYSSGSRRKTKHPTRLLLTKADTSRTIRLIERALIVLVSEKVPVFIDSFGATRRIRTDDLLITNQLLYQLS